MTVVPQIAVNVFKESVRDKILYNLIVFAVLLIAASYLLGELTAGQDIKIIKDLGLAAIATFGLLIAVFIGIGLVWKEVERKSIYSLLAKPIRRSEFVLGKYCGLALTLFVNVSVMTLAFYLVLAYIGWRELPAVRAGWPAPATDPAMLEAVLLIFVELLLVTGIALFFSTFSSPFLSASLTLGVWVIGHFNSDLRQFETVVNSPVAAWLARGLYYALPNFAAFDVKSQVVYGQPVAAQYIALTVLYGATYLALVLAAAVMIFSRRDFK
jgi:ABC-type transport system involved in multi-copper enzyme maturation permease subunit